MGLINKVLKKVNNCYFKKDYLQELLDNGLKVGKNFKMFRDVFIDEPHAWHIEIGDDVTLVSRVHILAHDASTKRILGYTRLGKVKIGNRVFVGAGAIILPGVTIGDDVIIGAGSVVSKDIPPGHVAVGNPAQVVCTLEDFTERKKRELDVYPVWGEEYTLGKNITPEMKVEMNGKMEDAIGYIV